MTGALSTDRVPIWRIINISPAERLGRVTIGVAAAIGGVMLLTAASSALTAVLEIALVLAGLDMIITGATGHCPLYQKLGHTLRTSRSSR